MKNYPDKVKEYINDWCEKIKTFLPDEGLEDASDQLVAESISTVIGDMLLQNFLKVGEPTIVLETENDGVVIINKIFTYIAIGLLKEKGLVDTIENEEGEEIVFLTEKGKETKNGIEL